MSHEKYFSYIHAMNKFRQRIVMVKDSKAVGWDE